MMRGGDTIPPPLARISRSKVSPLTGTASLAARREPGSPPSARPICCWISRSRRVRLALGCVRAKRSEDAAPAIAVRAAEAPNAEVQVEDTPLPGQVCQTARIGTVDTGTGLRAQRARGAVPV